MNRRDEYGRRTGYWVEYYYPSNKILSKGNYANDKKISMWEYYNLNGELTSQQYYS